MKRTLIKALIASWIFLVIFSGNLLAQCAMCKASVETNVNEDGIGFAARLNTGILYLFVTPYLLAIVIGFLWFRKSKQHKRRLEEAELRRQRFTNA
jgi:hypothetical protein